MKILLIADFHYGEDSNFLKHGGADYVNIFGSQFHTYLNTLKPEFKKYDLIVNLGDCINDHSFIYGLSSASYGIDLSYFKAFLNAWKDVEQPVFHVLGNHDGEVIPRADFIDLLGRNTYFSQDLGGIHHVVLDPVWGKYPYALDDAQIKWLQADLASTQLTTIIYIHTPCDEHDLSDNYYHQINPSRYFVAHREALRSIFEASGKVKLVVQGHAHFYANNNINGIKYLTLASFLENDTTNIPTGEYVDLSISTDKSKELLIRRKRVRVTAL